MSPRGSRVAVFWFAIPASCQGTLLVYFERVDHRGFNSGGDGESVREFVEGWGEGERQVSGQPVAGEVLPA